MASSNEEARKIIEHLADISARLIAMEGAFREFKTEFGNLNRNVAEIQKFVDIDTTKFRLQIEELKEKVKDISENLVEELKENVKVISEKLDVHIENQTEESKKQATLNERFLSTRGVFVAGIYIFAVLLAGFLFEVFLAGGVSSWLAK